ncbi:SH3 domain-containing protein [Roridomyces roridus]|uniref:SH3 domain-containing protein n=1 Tax=Roridomyces roridus TaxID=1738132 RepID=A0AAD7FZC5_9AGAR|nr:SH3 domain-containing protein [Roridomyces roridus]
MSARRQPSTTSLSKYARGDPVPHDRSTDFCNAFWGHADVGVDVLFARMRGATRTMEELRNFWKERATIEDEYARRLAKLAKQTLGRDEIGELRTSLDSIRAETERQAAFHLTLSQQVRADLEVQAAAFYAKQQHHKKTYQTAIEKEFKAKQTQEGYVNKAREKYEKDCMLINSFTGQLGLVQGKEAERIHLKLERAQQTVVSNERDFANFARALADTVAKWEQDWKVFCDSCQDLEEDRLEFTKDNMWAYANAVSTVCVSDDESCEKIRLSLEQMEPDKDMEFFVRNYGTGNQIPDPLTFVNFKDPNAIPSSESRPTFHPANFPRSSQRPPPLRKPSAQTENEEPATNAAGVGAGGTRRTDEPTPSVAVQQPPAQNHRAEQQPYVNGNGAPSDLSRRPTSATTKSVSPSYRVPPPDPLAEPIDPTADTFIKVGSNAYKVDLTKDPTQQTLASSRVSASAQKGGFDPLAKQMEDLQSAASAVRRRSTRNPNTRPSSSMSLAAPSGPMSQGQQQQQQQQPRAQSPASAMRDYRQSAEFVVGPHPSASRPSSPNPAPITAAFMRPASAGPAPGTDMVTDVLTDYHQSLPGERKSISRSNSRRGSYTGAPPSTSPSHMYNPSQSSQQGQSLARPPSTQGYAGIGSGSRSASPQPISRGPSPAPVIANVRHSFAAPPQHSGVSPNNTGITLDPSGRVHDEMAQRYQPQHRQSVQGPPSQVVYNPQVQPQRRLSYIGPGSVSPAPPPQQPSYAVTPFQHPQPGYVPPPPPPVQPAYNTTPYQPPAPAQQQQVYHPQPHSSGYGTVSQLQRGVSTSSSYFPDARQQQQQQLVRMPQQQQQQQQQLVRVPQQQMQLQPHQQPVQRSPSPHQAQQKTSDGKWILFYVKALFNYAATIEEEFDFQEGDIIAVTATPEDGWWSGELLDDSRRVPGKHIFPSNFVVLF